MKFFIVLPIGKKMLRVHIKDKFCNSPWDLGPVILLKRDSNTGVFL